MPQKLGAQLGNERMVVTLRSYLERLREAEAARPADQRRAVPELNELAKEIGVAASTLHRMANNQMDSINRKLAGAIIKALRARGFDTDVSDLIAYVEGE